MPRASIAVLIRKPEPEPEYIPLVVIDEEPAPELPPEAPNEGT